jgi:glycosyltransferase involved in cell wall biosynthesis
VIAMSSVIRDEAIAAGFREKRVVRIPHGVDPRRFTPVDAARRSELRRELLPSVPADSLLAIYTGRLLRGKGLEHLLDAIESLERPGMRLAIVGSGEGQTLSVEAALRARVAASERLRTRTTFVGRTDSIESYLQAADLFVFPTLDESFGISLVEAQACGLPAVASNTGGIPDIIAGGADPNDPGATGILVPPGDARALAAGLDALAADPSRRERLGLAARARVLERFDFETTVDRYEALFVALSRERSR